MPPALTRIRLIAGREFTAYVASLTFWVALALGPAAMAALVAKLAKGGASLHFCYEAGPTGYDLYRQIIGLGHDCRSVCET